MLHAVGLAQEFEQWGGDGTSYGLTKQVFCSIVKTETDEILYICTMRTYKGTFDIFYIGGYYGGY